MILMNRDTITQSGYRKFHNSGSTRQFDRYFFQKKITNSVGVLYFIDISEFDWSEYLQREGGQYSYEASAHFYISSGVDFGTMTCRNNDARDSINHVEEYFSRIWEKLGLGYYELF